MSPVKQSLAKNSAIIFGGNAIANASNYAYNIVMARFLGPELFGALTALLATMTIIGIPAMAILLGFTKFAADLDSEDAPGKLKYLWVSALKLIGIAGSILALVAIAFAGPITDALQIEATLPFILLMLSIPIGLLAAVNRGVVQGLEKFWAYAGSISAEGIAKVVLGTGFVYFGFRLGGATAAILAASVVAFVAVLPALQPLLRTKAVPFERRSLLRFSLFTLFVTLGITLFLNVDVIVAQAFLDGESAGRYAAASTIAKIIPYVVSAVVSAMLPRIAQLVSKRKQHSQVLTEAIGFTFIAGMLIYAVYLLAPEFVLGLLYGSLYLDAAPLLATLGGAMLIYALSNVFLTYFLSTKDGRVAWPLAISIVALLTLFWFYHDSPAQLATAMLGSSTVLLLAVGGTYGWVKRDRLAAIFQR